MQSILSINAGSSSIKFALYDCGDVLPPQFRGKVESIGRDDAKLFIRHSSGHQRESHLPKSDFKSAVKFLIELLENEVAFDSVAGVGHRLVHGMQHVAPEFVTQVLLDELQKISPFDPEHLPQEIGLIEELRRRHPALPQIVCFDTAFHRDMPRVAKLLPIPRRFDAKGIQRYGFHGISYAFLMEELARVGDPAALHGRVILAHLGNGASLAAVKDGRSIDTSMGFTPTSGLVMSTRTGDLDPGLVSYLMHSEQMTSAYFQNMVNHESGLLGISELSSDVRELLAAERTDQRAAEAISLFCYQSKKWIGSFAAALGGLDALVFAGGIGENNPQIRSRICDGLGFLGIQLDEPRNAAGGSVISTDQSRVRVRIIRTDEELMVARSVARMLGSSTTTKEE